jgi:protein required for attachment to host cells
MTVADDSWASSASDLSGANMTYDIQASPRHADARDWVLVANAARARLFERDAENGALRELGDWVHPEARTKDSALGNDRPGQAMKGQARTEFQAHTEPHEREQQRFAKVLARHLEEAALAHRIGRLALVVSNPFLGHLRAELGHATHSLLAEHIARDLTSWQGAELERRVTQALAEPQAV